MSNAEKGKSEELSQKKAAPEKKMEALKPEQMYKHLFGELKRSFNYYQAQMGQALPSKLIVDSVFKETEFYNSAISELKIPIEMFSLSKAVSLANPIDEKYQMLCFAAIGAGLDFEPLDDANEEEITENDDESAN